MVGGAEEGVRIAEPILTALAVKGGYIHTGKPGTGHFVKLVHNGIEFGMLQSIGEGVELLIKVALSWTWQQFSITGQMVLSSEAGL